MYNNILFMYRCLLIKIIIWYLLIFPGESSKSYKILQVLLILILNKWENI